MIDKPIKVAIFFNMMAPYQIPLVKQLSKYEDLQMTVFAYTRSEKDRLWEIDLEAIQADYKPLRGISLKKRHINPLIPWVIMKNKFDIILVGVYSSPSTWLAVLTAKILGRKVIARVGSTKYSEENVFGKNLTDRLKKVYFKLCDAYLAYGTASQKYLESYGCS